jgi:hypothetical protein
LRSNQVVSHNCDSEDFIFQVNDANISFESASTPGDYDEGNTDLKDSTVYMHGNTKQGDTVCVEYEGYMPYFWVSLPEGNSSCCLLTKQVQT